MYKSLSYSSLALKVDVGFSMSCLLWISFSSRDFIVDPDEAAVLSITTYIVLNTSSISLGISSEWLSRCPNSSDAVRSPVPVNFPLIRGQSTRQSLPLEPSSRCEANIEINSCLLSSSFGNVTLVIKTKGGPISCRRVQAFLTSSIDIMQIPVNCSTSN